MLVSKYENLLAQKAVASSSLNFGRIAKPLRGGGGGGTGAVSAPTLPTTLPSSSGGPSNPIARLQNEDAGWVVIFSLVKILTAITFLSIAQIM